MTYRVIVRPEVESDIDAEVAWYEQEQAGVGVAFMMETGAAIDRLPLFPKQHREAFDDVRVAFVKQFPFGVFFIIDDHALVVLGVLDLRTNPATRRARVQGRVALARSGE